ncbi:MAG: hypothetical protein LBP81_03410 [Treponema sp.]|jgi:hypothetical protein|nr:hypothetical protein [Treponema sp.]
MAIRHSKDNSFKLILGNRLNGGGPLFAITIVEQESKVNSRVPFKMLQYIRLVLDNYEKELGNRNAPRTITVEDSGKYD